MATAGVDFWPDETSVLFTSFWGWEPGDWGTVGWTGVRGRTRRENLLKELSDPFITVVYVTGNRNDIDRSLKRMIAGFYLTTHETGDRNEYVDPRFHQLEPTKWRHSVRAARAFSYLPEYRLGVDAFDPTIALRALDVASMGKVLDDRQQIRTLRETPWIEVPCYQRGRSTPSALDREEPNGRGRVRAGPGNENGYEVSPTAADVGRQLYVLRLDGGTDAYLGRPCKGCAIYKIGLSFSPDLRRQAFQKSMPRGMFNWCVARTTSASRKANLDSFEAAVAGEDAMKQHLAQSSEWLGGEFYLATEDDIDEAWRLGHAAATAFRAKK